MGGVSAFSITRRSVLVAGGVLAAQRPISALALVTPDPVVTQRDDIVSVSYASQTWRLATLDFGKRAKVTLVEDKTSAIPDGLTEPPAAWKISISELAPARHSAFRQWHGASPQGCRRLVHHVRIPGFWPGRYALAARLVKWGANAAKQSGKEPGDACPTVSCAGHINSHHGERRPHLDRGGGRHDGCHQLLLDRRRCRNCRWPPGFRPGVGRIDITIANLDHAPAELNDDPAIRILFDRLPDGPVTRLRLSRVGPSEAGTPLAVSRSGVRLSLNDAQIAGGMLRYFERPSSDCLFALEYEFTADFAPTVAAVSTALPALPLVAARYHLVDDAKTGETSLLARVAEKAFATNGHVRLVASGIEDRQILRLKRVKANTEITAFEIRAALHTAFVPMKAVDLNRIDFRKFMIRFFLHDLIDPRERDLAECTYVLGPTPIFGAVLDVKATLSMHRAADLLDLKYDFRNLYLRATPDGALIEKCTKLIGGVAMISPDPAMMIVRFPPQHIAEKAYLRLDGGQPIKDKENAVPIGEHRIYETGNEKAAAIAKLLAANDRKDIKPNIDAARNERDADYDSYAKPKALEIFDRVVEARAAGATRIAFEIPDVPENDAATIDGSPPLRPLLPMEFSATSLTDWKRLKTVVSARALPLTATPLEQLNLAGITPVTPIEGITGKLRTIAELAEGIRSASSRSDEH